MTGKEKCKILRTIRRRIAEVNRIPYPSEEEDVCEYEGEDCTGTCPRCEMEVQYLDMMLTKRRREGEPVILQNAGEGLVPFESEPEPLQQNPEDEYSNEEQRLLAQMKDHLWTELAEADFPAEVVVRLQGNGIVTIGELTALRADQLKEQYQLTLKQIEQISDMLTWNCLPEIRGIRALKQRQIRGMMRSKRF